MRTRDYLTLLTAPLISGGIAFILVSFCLVLVYQGELQKASYSIPVLIVSQLSLFCFSLLALRVGRRSYAKLWEKERLFDWLGKIYDRGLSGWRLFLLVAIVAGLLSSGLSLLSREVFESLGKGWVLASEDAVQQQIRTLMLEGSATRWGVLLSVVLAGVVEEVFFRAYYQRIVRAWMRGNALGANLIVSLIFSLIHFSAVGFLSRFVLGFALGYLYERTDRISAPILLHVLNNLLAYLLLYLDIFGS